MSNTLDELNQEVRQSSGWVATLRKEIGRVVVGQQYLVDRLIVGLLANGHVLLEGVPGLAKTLSVRTLDTAIQAKFNRIQFTPDLLPADIIGTLIYNPQDGKPGDAGGVRQPGARGRNRRAPAKVQSALLEAMQERQVTLGGETMPFPRRSWCWRRRTHRPGGRIRPGRRWTDSCSGDRDYPSMEERKILDTMASPRRT
jgi:MoxR-like ATPase